MTPSVAFGLGNVLAEVITEEGGVLSKLNVGGLSRLAQTPWSQNVSPSLSPAPDEQTWVNNWRGGWQLCAPNSGIPQEGSRDPAFHGAASQANWEIEEQTDTGLKLSWKDPAGEIELIREWALGADGDISAETSATNHSDEDRSVGFAEHLILGTDFLEPVKNGSVARLRLCPSSKIMELDYTGAPLGKPPVPIDASTQFTQLSREQSARVFAVCNPKKKTISVEVGAKVAVVTWQGLDHALIWQEFGTSKETPWNGEVFALGIEPTNVPHGLGASDTSGPFLLAGQTMSWKTSLRFHDRNGELDDPAT